MSTNPSYFSILTADVRYDEDLTSSEKLLYSEVTALANKNGYCNATNNYFAKLYNVHKMTISKWVTNLENKGYIRTEIIKNNGVIKERRIYINTDTISKKVDTPISEKTYTPISENAYYNNTRINNTRVNNNITLTSSDCQSIIDFYNATCLSLPQVKQLTETRKKTILARVEAFGLDKIREVFIKANESDFLSGRVKSKNPKHQNWKASFDWLMNATNFVRVLEDTYKTSKATTINDIVLETDFNIFA